jgi:hypothetical protein
MKSKSNLPETEVNQVIEKAIVCNIGMIDASGNPYVLPFNFGYRHGRLYIHCAPHGKKIDAWDKNPRVCVAFSTDYEMRVQNESVACSYSMRYRSVLIHGVVSPITEYDGKIQALNIIMEKYSGKSDFTYNRPAVENVKVFEIIIDRIESRSYGY